MCGVVHIILEEMENNASVVELRLRLHGLHVGRGGWFEGIAGSSREVALEYGRHAFRLPWLGFLVFGFIWVKSPHSIQYKT